MSPQLRNGYYNAKASRRFLRILLRKELPNFPNDRFPQIEGLCFEAISKFSSITLRSCGHCLGPGAVVQPVEAQYRNEFYRACYIILNYNVYLTSEWSASLTHSRTSWFSYTPSRLDYRMRQGRRQARGAYRLIPKWRKVSWSYHFRTNKAVHSPWLPNFYAEESER